MLNKNVIVFLTTTGILGGLGAINYLENIVTVVDVDGNTHTSEIDEALFLEEVGELGGEKIFNMDVILLLKENKMCLVELKEDGENVQIHPLNNKLEKLESGEVFKKSMLSELEGKAVLLNNFFMMEPEDVVDFNIKVVKETSQEGIAYYYACNNKELEEIDLIKVIFMGHQLLEEDYQRVTFSYEEFLELMDGGVFKYVNPSELYNFVTGSLYGKTYGKTYEEKEDVNISQEEKYEFRDFHDLEDCDLEDEYEDDICEECGESMDYCECETSW